VRIFSRTCLVVAGALVGLACSQQSQDPLVEIRKLQEEGRYAATVDPLRRLVDEDPSRIEAQYLLGTALLRSGNGGLAVWPLRVAAQTPEYAIEARLMLAQAMLESRTAPDAIKVLDEVLEKEPDNVRALVMRIQGYQAVGRNEDALADIKRVLELDPDNIPVLVPRVTALIASKKIDEAEAAIEDARKRLDAAGGEVDPSARPMLCIARGLFAFEKGEREVAEKQYEECLKLFPDNTFVVNESVSFYAMLGQQDRGIDLLKAALERTGNSAFRVALANWMKAFGNTDEEERLLREQAETEQTVEAWFRLADLYVGRDDFDKALDAFDRAIALSPNPPEPLRFAYADTLVQAKQYDKARKVVEGLDQSVFRDLITGRILLAEGDPRGALASFEKGILLWPNSAAARFLAGQAAEQIGDFDRAVSEYRESVRADASRTTAGLELAALYSAQGHNLDALDAIQRYLQANPGDLDGTIAAIRIAHKTRRYGIATEGLNRLSEMPGQAARATAEHATLLAEGSPDGASVAVKTIEEAKLDLTDPANVVALRTLLTYLGELGQHAKAQEQISSALRAHPDVAEFHELDGTVLEAAGKPAEQVRAEFNRALELDPNEVGATIGLAELATKAGDIDSAVALYDQAAALDTEHADAALAAAKLELDRGRTAEAKQRLEAILTAHPREANASIDLARILAEQGEFEASLDQAHRAEWLKAPDADKTIAWIEGLRAKQGEAGDTPAASKL